MQNQYAQKSSYVGQITAICSIESVEQSEILKKFARFFQKHEDRLQK